MSASAALSLILRFAWPMLVSLALPTIASHLHALDPGNGLLATLADLMNGVASTQPGGYHTGRKISALEALFL
jgi:hypothetical protein